MATAPTQSLTDERIVSPLAKLNSALRTYVIIEGVLIAGLFLAAYFWIGLLLDYGVFKLTGAEWVRSVFKNTTIDWVQWLPAIVRRIILAGVGVTFVGLLLWHIAYRLMSTFSDESLALLLERRFPQELGDRLITAVELADPIKVRKYGYSSEMVERTIREAAERVERLPVNAVFAWARLRSTGYTLVAGTLGLFLVLGLCYCVIGQRSVSEFGYRFGDVASIWLERNVYMQNTIWPRNAHLELIDFPSSGDLRLGRDGVAPRLQVLAFKWVIADRGAPEGWRPLLWGDVTTELVGQKIAPLPMNVVAAASCLKSNQVPVDRAETLLSQPEVRAAITALEGGGERLIQLDRVFERLTELSDQPWMARTLRALIVPEVVQVAAWGNITSAEMPLRRDTNNLYAGELKDLKESVLFVVSAEDYSTAPRSITLVPPPVLTLLVRDEARPAYLHHRPPLQAGPAGLKGLKQVFRNEGISITGAISRFEVPVGTQVVLRGEVDKPLASASLQMRSVQKSDEPPPAPIELQVAPDRLTFSYTFSAVTRLLEFDLIFTDTDNVVGKRTVQIQTVEDRFPEVEVAVETLRKTSQGFIITPIARVPFSDCSKVQDDVGLASVEYRFSYQKLELSANDVRRAFIVAQTLNYLQAVPNVGNLAASARTLAEVGPQLAALEIKPATRTAELETFRGEALELDRRYARLPTELAKQLDSPIDRTVQPLQKVFMFRPEDEAFDLAKLAPELRSAEGTTAIQPRYVLRLTVAATDNNVETGPRTGQNKETLTFLVVSEDELLVEVGKEQEILSVKSNETLNRLKDAKLKQAQLIDSFGSLAANEFSPAALRAQELLETVQKGRDIVQELAKDYTRIVTELRANRVLLKKIEDVEQKILAKLEEVLRAEFVQSEEAQTSFFQSLNSKQKPNPEQTQRAQDRLQNLIDKLAIVLDAMGKENDINKLRTLIVEIEKRQRQEIGHKLEELKMLLEDETIDALGSVSLKAENITLDKEQKTTVTVQILRDEVNGALTLKLKPPADSGLTLPKEIAVGRGAKVASFEVMAGNKAGTFTVPIGVWQRDTNKGPELKLVITVR
jgi:hypothetical protein